MANCKKGVFGKQDNPTIVLSEIKQTIIYQFAGWSNNLLDVGDKFAESVKIKNFPKTNKAEGSVDTAILRIEPLKWWLVSTELWDEVTHPSFEFFEISKKYKLCELNLTNSRTHIRVSGESAVHLLNRHLSIDLREKSFNLNSIASTNFHHCSVTLWKSTKGYELFLPRAFALSLWEIFIESAGQFGYEIK